MKILLATYSAETHSSYGIVTRELWRRLLRMNPHWEVIQHGWLHRSSESVPWLIEPTLTAKSPQGPAPVLEDKFGKISFPQVVERYRPDIVWTLSDPYMCDYMGSYRTSMKFRLIKHLPVDGAPQPASWGDGIRDADTVVPITNFGARVLAKFFDGTVLPHIYHGVDTDRFHPISMEERRQKRPAIASMTPSSFVLGFVGHSQWRKQTWNMFMLIRYMKDGAFVICDQCDRVSMAPWDDIEMKTGPIPSACEHCRSDLVSCPGPQDVTLWYHTFNRQGCDFDTDRLKKNWDVEGRVIFTTDMKESEGIPDTDMPHLYRMFDAYLSLSGGEGFCIPIVEAMASGIPTIYTDYSGQAEVGAYAGLPVRPLILQPNFKEPVNRAIADVGDAIRQVYRLIHEKHLYDTLCSKALSAARDVFNWDVVASQWNTLIHSAGSTRRVKTLGVSL